MHKLGVIVPYRNRPNQLKHFLNHLKPYLDKKDIGILVTKELRHRWKLFDKGDEINLPIILKQINEIDIVYYDSGKSYSGKKIFFDKIMIFDIIFFDLRCHIWMDVRSRVGYFFSNLKMDRSRSSDGVRSSSWAVSMLFDPYESIGVEIKSIGESQTPFLDLLLFSSFEMESSI